MRSALRTALLAPFTTITVGAATLLLSMQRCRASAAAELPIIIRQLRPECSACHDYDAHRARLSTIGDTQKHQEQGQPKQVRPAR